MYTSLAYKLQKDKDSDLSSVRASTTYAATQLNYYPLSTVNYLLFKNSEILTLWDVSVKDRKPEQNFGPNKVIRRETAPPYTYTVFSILIGLARNKKTKEIFHWITGLNRDIDVLFAINMVLNNNIKKTLVSNWNLILQY